METNQELDLLSGISAAFHELRESLSGRDADIAKTAGRVCWQLNSELLRVDPLLSAARAEMETLKEALRVSQEQAGQQISEWREASLAQGRELAAARAEAEKLEALHRAAHHSANEWMQQAKAARAEVETVRALLSESREWVEMNAPHGSGCDPVYCLCGRADLLQRIEESLREER